MPKITKFLVAIMMITLIIFQAESLTIAEKHKQWMAYHSRTYKDDAEFAKRFHTFKRNLLFQENFNSQTKQTYKLSLNKFADMTNEEFVSSHTGYINSSPSLSSEKTSVRYQNFTNDIPESLDWRKKGAVTPIKDQGECARPFYPVA
ncbi:hypothetical protein ACFE04_020168 [Oxalis oulophora]